MAGLLRWAAPDCPALVGRPTRQRRERCALGRRCSRQGAEGQMMERIRGFLWSAALHAGLWALVFLPWSVWVGGRGSSSAAAELSHYVPIPLLPGDLPVEK